MPRRTIDKLDQAIANIQAPVRERLHLEIPSQSGFPIVLEFTPPLTAIDVVRLLVAEADIVQGKVQPIAPKATDRLVLPRV